MLAIISLDDLSALGLFKEMPNPWDDMDNPM